MKIEWLKLIILVLGFWAVLFVSTLGISATADGVSIIPIVGLLISIGIIGGWIARAKIDQTVDETAPTQ